MVLVSKLPVMLACPFSGPLPKENRILLGLLLSEPVGVSGFFGSKSVYKAGRKPAAPCRSLVPRSKSSCICFICNVEFLVVLCRRNRKWHMCAIFPEWTF